MTNLPETITSLSLRHGFTRSAGYDQAWMFDNAMGPDPLWLAEWLTRDMRLTADMTVLDMGCGKAVTSVFLAKEFGCTVFANDLWISADDNLKQVTAHSLQGKIFPIHAEAHAIPYAKGFFDAITSVDAYQYFGTDDLYLEYFSKFVKPGGEIGIVVPGWSRERSDAVPPDFANFHTCSWWRTHFSRTGHVEVEICEEHPHAHEIWLDSAKAVWETKRILRASDGTPPDKMKSELDFWRGDIDFLEADKEDYFTLIRLIARRKK